MATCTSDNYLNIISKVIRNCYSELVNHLNPNSLVDDLFRAKCLSNEEQIRVLSPGYQHARNRELLDILMTKDDVALSVLLKHLKRCHVHLYNLLKEKNVEFQSELMIAEETVVISMCSKIWFVPRNPLSNFVGRADELNLLQSFYVDSENSDIPVIISGQGGIGKSSLVTSFLYSEFVASDHETNVIWINAASEETIQESLLDLVAELEKVFKIRIDKGLKSRVMMQEIYRELGEYKSIFVFDSADDMLVLKPFLPIGMPLTMRNPTVIVTTRPHPCLNSDDRTIKLGVWKQDEAIEFIRSILSESSDLDCKALTDQLAGLPLALQQAVSCMKGNEQEPPAKQAESQTSRIQKYLKQFQKNREKLLADERFRDCLDTDYNATALVSWFTNFEKLLKQPNSREAVHILRFFRKRKSMKLAVLKRNLQLRQRFLLGCAIMYSDEGLALLTKYSLVTAGHDSIEMHQLNSYATKAFFDLVLDAGQSLPNLLISFFGFLYTTLGMIILPKSDAYRTSGIVILSLASLYFLYMVSRNGYRLYRGRKLFAYAMSLHKGLMYNKANMIFAIVMTVLFIFAIILKVLEASFQE